MDTLILGPILKYLARALVDLLWKVYRRPVVLGAAILGLTGSGLGLIIGSHAVTGWWQSALLGFGTGLILAGTLELGIIGLVNRILEPDSQQWKREEPEPFVQVDGKTQTVLQPVSGTVATPREVAAILRELASSLERGAADV